MRRLRFLVTLIVGALALLIFADPALAVTHSGQGLYGPTDDVTITNMMFFLILFFPGLILVLTLFQGFLDRRKHHKWEREKAAAAANPDRGGW
jgi:hypothetical protein